jgi:hypothetical protein
MNYCSENWSFQLTDLEETKRLNNLCKKTKTFEATLILNSKIFKDARPQDFKIICVTNCKNGIWGITLLLILEIKGTVEMPKFEKDLYDEIWSFVENGLNENTGDIIYSMENPDGLIDLFG